MISNYKVPPGFDEGKPYESWKNEVAIWTRVTELEKDKQALAVVLALSGRAWEMAMETPVDDLNKRYRYEYVTCKTWQFVSQRRKRQNLLSLLKLWQDYKRQ